MHTLKVEPGCIEFTPGYAAEMRLFGKVFTTIFSVVAILVILEFGLVIGVLFPITMAGLTLTLINYEAIYRIELGSVTFERKWLGNITTKLIPLNNFVSIKIETNISRKRGIRLEYYPILWSRDNSIFSQRNHSFSGSISNLDFKEMNDFMRLLKIMSNLINLPISFSKGCPERFLDLYGEVSCK